MARRAPDQKRRQVAAQRGGSSDERFATVAEVRVETRTLAVFNLEVADAHTFLVGSDGLLVHNAAGGLPSSTIVSEDGVTVTHNYHSNDHAPPHAHVSSGGKDAKVGQNGKPIDGSRELTPKERRVVERNKPKIRSAMRKIMRWHKNNCGIR